MEIKMSVEESNQTAANVSCMNMESVNRIAKLPVVESTLNTATSFYGKVKEYNSITQWTLGTAEDTVHKAVEIGKPYATPVVSQLEGSIKKVDGLLCTGLDYVEEKVPAVKLPPGELFLQMYNGAKDYVNSTVGPAVQTARNYVEPTVETAKHLVEPAVESAKHFVEPAYETAKQFVEPYVQPAVDKAYALKDYGTHKVEELLNLNAEEKDEATGECNECLGTPNVNVNNSKSEDN